MSQEKQTRNKTMALLTRAEMLVDQWQDCQAKAQQLLDSVCNISRQREATQQLDADWWKECAVDRTQLVYKQSIAMEKTLAQLNRCIDTFESLVHDWDRLWRDTCKHLTVVAGARTKDPLASGPAPLSTESLMQVVSLKPDQAHDIIGRLQAMYRVELLFKHNLWDSLPASSCHPDLIQSLTDRWAKEPHIQHTLIQDLTERLVLYKNADKILHSSDYKAYGKAL